MPDQVRKLVIVGAGGHAREILQIVADINSVRCSWEVMCFVVEKNFLIEDSRLSAPVLALEQLPRLGPEVSWIIAIGASAARRRIASLLESSRAPTFATLVHPSATVATGSTVGPGCVLFPGSVATANFVIGWHTHLNACSSVSHDSVIGDFVTLAPHACVCGSVVVEDDVEVGAGALILPRLRVGKKAVVGAGAVVTKSVLPGSTVVGVPARPV